MQGSLITLRLDPELTQEQHTWGLPLPLWAAQDTREQRKECFDKLLDTSDFARGVKDIWNTLTVKKNKTPRGICQGTKEEMDT